MTTSAGETVWADGFRPTDGAIVEAKNVRTQGCSPRTLDRLQQSDRATGFLLTGDGDELQRLGDAATNPTNHAQFVEIDTNDPEALSYWQYLCAERHVKADVRYTP
jgi:hypothetical protein